MSLPRVRRKSVELFSLLWLGVLASSRVEARAWPFDQRNILLAKTSGQDFPEDLTTAQVLDVFVKKGRVRWVLKKGGRGEIVPIEVPNDFPWQSSVAVKKLGMRYKVDGVVHLQMRGPELDLRWYSVADGEPMFFEKVNLPAAGPRPEEQDLRRKRLADFLEDIWLRIPGQGYVVKRDMTTLTFEGAAPNGIQVGDTLEIRRLEQAERHPLLKTFIGIRSTLSGMAQVTEMGDPFSMAKITYESSADPIQEGDRYDLQKKKEEPAAPGPPAAAAPGKENSTKPGQRQVIPLKGDAALKDSPGEGAVSAAEAEGGEKKTSEDEGVPQEEISKSFLVDVGGRLGWGSLNHTEAVAEGSKEISGKGPTLELTLRGYITQNWVLDGRFGLSHYSPENIDSSYGAGKIGADLIQYRVGAGYRFLFLQDPYFPGECVVSVGYQQYSFSITQLASPFAPMGKRYTGLDLALSLRIPVKDQFYGFAGGNRILGASLVESPLTTANASSSVVWNFEAGVMYRLAQQSYVAGGFQMASSNSTFTGSGERDIPAVSNVISTSSFFGAYVHRF